jgi:FixJ family two-component response regulator
MDVRAQSGASSSDGDRHERTWHGHFDACSDKGAAPLEEPVKSEPSLVSVVDDDESVRESLPHLVSEFGYAVQAFASAEEFLASDCVSQTGCLILDIAMPGISGPDLQRVLVRQGYEIPIIFITAHGDETVRPRMLEQGAVECLYKPFSDEALKEALNAAFTRDTLSP